MFHDIEYMIQHEPTISYILMFLSRTLDAASDGVRHSSFKKQLTPASNEQGWGNGLRRNHFDMIRQIKPLRDVPEHEGGSRFSTYYYSSMPC